MKALPPVIIRIGLDNKDNQPRVGTSARRTNRKAEFVTVLSRKNIKIFFASYFKKYLFSFFHGQV